MKDQKFHDAGKRLISDLDVEVGAWGSLVIYLHLSS